MVEIHFSPAALEDLKEIKYYITEELFSEQSAVRTLEKILKHIRQLESFPDLGAPLSSIVSMDVPYRFLVCGNYLAFYTKENEEVLIIRVLDGRRDYLQILFGPSSET